MIIQSLTANNFRKYAHLKIDDIPEKGLITVSGSNESGKTSIADALSFALFGRTFFTDEANVRKLVRWGEKAATVVLCFKRQDKHYELSRTVDKEGRVEAELLDVDTAGLLAETPQETAEVLQGILGYGYEAFSDSFYLVQRELSTPHPNSDSLKDMVGISAYSKVSNDLQRANERDAAELEIVRPKYEANYQTLKDLGIDGTWLPDLIDARETLNTDNDENQLLAAQLGESAKIYAEDQRLYEQMSRKHRWLEIFSDIVLALLVGVLVLWAALRFLPELTKTVLFIPETVERFASVYAWNEKWMLLVAAIIAWSFFLSLLYTWRTEDKGLIPLEENATLFGTALSAGQKHVSESLIDQLPPRCHGLLSKYDDDHHRKNDDMVGIDELRAMRENDTENEADKVVEDLAHSAESARQQRMQELAGRVKYYEANPALPAEAAKLLRIQLKERSKGNVVDQQVLKGEIDHEIERTEVAADLRKKLAIHDEAIRNHTRHIKVQNTAIDLLRTSSKEFTEVFNRSITQASASILPHFTNGHYSNIKIDENLNVGVFSQEKNDFMDFDEISSGTQRQIMLALRIAMSEELAKQHDEDQQYIILDEPFAFFDMERTIATLEKLPEVSDIICQVWVVSQEFPSGTEPDKAIACTDATELIV
jgi:exonuclease SbcC